MADRNLVVLDWPPCSPDLNPIEEIWATMKHHLELAEPTNLEDMRSKMDKIWYEVATIYGSSYFKSMDARLETCIALNGDFIKMKHRKKLSQ